MNLHNVFINLFKITMFSLFKSMIHQFKLKSQILKIKKLKQIEM